MKCDICQENDANVHIQQDINGEIKSLRICSECAGSKHLTAELLADGKIADLLSGIMTESKAGTKSLLQFLNEMAGVTSPKGVELSVEQECGGCGTSLSEFRSSGLLGCAYCYGVFRDAVTECLREIHGSTQHVGKVYSGDPITFDRDETMADKMEPQPPPDYLELERLRRMLDAAVAAENYEYAAELRDKIQALPEIDMEDIPF